MAPHLRPTSATIKSVRLLPRLDCYPPNRKGPIQRDRTLERILIQVEVTFIFANSRNNSFLRSSLVKRATFNVKEVDHHWGELRQVCPPFGRSVTITTSTTSHHHARLNINDSVLLTRKPREPVIRRVILLPIRRTNRSLFSKVVTMDRN